MTAPHVVLIRRGIKVTVDDVHDPALMRTIESSVREALRHLSGKWDVTLKRSTERREWVLRLRGASGLHVATFATAPHHLPRRVGEKLEAFLEYKRGTRSHLAQ